jgi:anaerobic selenocysteine-containing dehydrogenase
MEEIKRTVCMGCHAHCRVAVYLENERLVKVEEDREHRTGEELRPVVRACSRARAAREWFYHPERLSYPLKRVGEKGEDEIAEKLGEIKERYGAEALALTRGTYRGAQDEFYTRFFDLFGSPNLIGGPANICDCPDNMISSAIIGWPANWPRIRPGLTKCFLMLGTNPAQSGRRFWLRILDAQKAGMKLIVVDPRRTEPAERADIWLQIRPGTDVALMMGMINVIIDEGLYDREFVEKWCHGFDKLAERAKDYPLERVSEITWLPADKIREAARMYATSKPAVSHDMMGIEQIPNSGQAMHARFILPAITGNLDIRGGDLLSGPFPKVISDYEMELNDKLPPEQKAKMLGQDQARLFSWQCFDMIQENLNSVWGMMFARNAHCHAFAPTAYRAILTGQPYPVRAAISSANNPMVNHANIKLVHKALKSLDLYVVVDLWRTPSAEIADYVLPAASWLERPHLHTMENIMPLVDVGEAALPHVVAGEYDRRRDYDIWRGLGIRLGQEEYWPWQSLEEVIDYRLTPLGHTIDSFIKEKGGTDIVRTEERKYERTGFATNTGKVELYCTIFEKLGLDPLPQYEEPFQSPVSDPQLAEEYPLILITGGRHLPYYHSEYRQIETMRKQHPDPIMQINPETAAELGISDADWVWIETPTGRVRQKCQCFDGIDRRVIHAQHGWWFPELPGEEPWLHGVWESNINVVTDDAPEHCNKITGGWPLRAILCKVYKAIEY